MVKKPPIVAMSDSKIMFHFMAVLLIEFSIN